MPFTLTFNSFYWPNPLSVQESLSCPGHVSTRRALGHFLHNGAVRHHKAVGVSGVKPYPYQAGRGAFPLSTAERCGHAGEWSTVDRCFVYIKVILSTGAVDGMPV